MFFAETQNVGLQHHLNINLFPPQPRRHNYEQATRVSCLQPLSPHCVSRLHYIHYDEPHFTISQRLLALPNSSLANELLLAQQAQ